jgi:hypothetical protein
MTTNEDTLKLIYKEMVGLGNVDNTSDLNKPISNATQTALNSKLNLAGGTLVGGLTGTTATFSGDVISKGISISSLNSGKLNLSGGTLIGGLTGTVATFTGDVISNGISISSLNSGKLNLAGGTLTGGLTGTLATFSGDVKANSISITSLNSGKLNLAGGTLTGGLTGTVATFSGDLIANSISITALNSGKLNTSGGTLSGGLTGTLATFSGDVKANSISITALNSGKLNLAGGTLTGGLTGTLATFSGDVIANNISVTALNSGKLSLSGGTLSGGLTGTVATFSGDVIGNGVSITSLNSGKLSLSGGTLSGGLTGTVATFSGDVIGNGVSITSLNTGKLSLSGGTLSGGLTGTVATFSGDVIGSGISISSLNTRVTTLESTASSSSGSTAALSTYTTEIDAFFDGVNQGSQYIKNSTVYAVENKYKTVYRMTGDKTTSNVAITNAYLSYNTSPSAAYSALASNNQWTVEAVIYPMKIKSCFLFDPRSSNSENQGMVFSLLGNPLKPGIWVNYDMNNGGGFQTYTGATTIDINKWYHIAWVKNLSSNPITIFINGVSAGTVSYTPTVVPNWSKVIVGSGEGFTGQTWDFEGRLGGLKISNVPLYTTTFTPLQTLTKYSKTSLVTGTNNTVFLLGPNRKDYVSNVTLTATAATGTIENYNEMLDIPLNSYSPVSQLYLTAPLQNNICGIYTAASIISTSTWQCHYGIGSDITIGSKWRNNYTNLLSFGRDLVSLTSTAANFAAIKAIVMIFCHGNDIINDTTWFSSNHPLIAGGTVFVGINGSLGPIVNNLVATTELYLDNIVLKNQSTTNSVLPNFYSGSKWSVMILNNTSLPSNSLEFLGGAGSLDHHAYGGTKLGCIIYYNTVLTSTNITDITKWGLERFGSF